MVRRLAFEAYEARAPAMLVTVAAVGVREVLLREHHAGAAGHRLERDGDLGLVAAQTGIVVPAPGEDEAARWLDRAVNAAHRVLGAVRTAHGGAPAPARAHVHRVLRRREAFRPPPFDEFLRFG